MPITDYLMSVGDWSMRLVPDTPQAITDLFRFGANVMFTPQRIADSAISHASLGTNAVYNGIVWEQTFPEFARSRPGQAGFTFSGPSALGYLQSGKGHAGNPVTPRAPAFPATFAQLLTAWITGDQYSNYISLGSSSSPTATTIKALDAYTYDPPLKPQIDTAAKQTGNEYRLNPNLTLDYGVATSLFRSTPQVVIAPGITGRETSITALDVETWRVSQDVRDIREHVVGYTSDHVSAYSAFWSTTDHVDQYAYGSAVNTATWRDVVVSDSTNSGDAQTVATAAANEYAAPKRSITCQVRDVCIPRLIQAGDYIYVYDQRAGLVDTANQVQVGGRVLFPKKMRCVGFTYPIDASMGVYVDSLGVITDVTKWVAFEAGVGGRDTATTLNIESLPRQTAIMSRSKVR